MIHPLTCSIPEATSPFTGTSGLTVDGLDDFKGPLQLKLFSDSVNVPLA